MNIHEYLMSLEPDTTAVQDTHITQLQDTITRLGIALADALEQLANQ